MSAPSRRAVLAAPLGVAAAAPAAARISASHPDADLVIVCEQHMVNQRAVLAVPNGIDLDEDCPAWVTYVATLRVIEQAEPQTMVGVLAKARAALAEAIPEEDSESFSNTFGFTCHAWAWDLLQDLARIHGLQVEDPRTGEAA